MASADFSSSLKNETSHRKTNRFQRITQDLHSRLRITFWLRSPMPACQPLICLLSCFCSSLPAFAFGFLQTLPRGNALAFSYGSQLSTSVRDLHPQVIAHAGRTKEAPLFPAGLLIN